MSTTAATPEIYRLRLIVAGTTTRSRRAIETIRVVCDTHLPGMVDLEVVDIYQLPEMAREYQVIAAPTLLKLLPLPVRRVIGDLSNSDRLITMLNLAPLTPQ